jgi:hypothetical protein
VNLLARAAATATRRGRKARLSVLERGSLELDVQPPERKVVPVHAPAVAQISAGYVILTRVEVDITDRHYVVPAPDLGT